MGMFLRCLAYSWVALLGALPLGCLIAGLLSGLVGSFLPASSAESLPDALGGGLVLAIPAVLMGWLPAFVYGAPVYALLASRGRANYLTAGLVGVAPAAFGWNAPAVMGVLALYGVSVACLTHLFVSLWLRVRGHGPGDSSRPKPLRSPA